MTITIQDNGTVLADGLPVAIAEPAWPDRPTEYRVLSLSRANLGVVRQSILSPRWAIGREVARYKTRERAIAGLLKRRAAEAGRPQAADQALELYDFGPEHLVSSGPWEHKLENSLHCRVRLRLPDGRHATGTFRVDFRQGSSEVESAYILTGSISAAG